MGFFSSKNDTSEQRETSGYNVPAEVENRSNNRENRTDRENDDRDRSHFFSRKS